MAKLNKIWNYIKSSFSLINIEQKPIHVEETSIEQYWQNVGQYLNTAMKHHETQLTDYQTSEKSDHQNNDGRSSSNHDTAISNT